MPERIPVFYDPSVYQHKAMQAGDKLPSNVFPLSVTPNDNILQLKADGLYVPPDAVQGLDAGDQVLTLTNYLLKANLSLSFNPTTKVIQLLGKNGPDTLPLVISSITLPADQTLSAASLVTNPSGQPAGTYLQLDFTPSTIPSVFVNVGSLMDIYTAGNNGISIVGKAVSLVVKSGSHLIIGANGLDVEAGYGFISSTDQSKLDSIVLPVVSNAFVTSAPATRADLAAGSYYTVPGYVVGKYMIDVFLSGVHADPTMTYNEVGTANAVSTQIQWLTIIPASMRISVYVRN